VRIGGSFSTPFVSYNQTLHSGISMGCRGVCRSKGYVWAPSCPALPMTGQENQQGADGSVCNWGSAVTGHRPIQPHTQLNNWYTGQK
jgi:hypothetical protein